MFYSFGGDFSKGPCSAPSLRSHLADRQNMHKLAEAARVLPPGTRVRGCDGRCLGQQCTSSNTPGPRMPTGTRAFPSIYGSSGSSRLGAGRQRQRWRLPCQLCSDGVTEPDPWQPLRLARRHSGGMAAYATAPPVCARSAGPESPAPVISQPILGESRTQLSASSSCLSAVRCVRRTASNYSHERAGTFVRPPRGSAKAAQWLEQRDPL